MQGTIKRIIGQVVDVDFGETLPAIYTALHVESNGKILTLETEQNLGGGLVRTVAMDTTDGFARGMKVTSTGGPITVPVGKETLGRLFNVLGEVIDDLPPLSSPPKLGGEGAAPGGTMRPDPP